jgi:ribosomal protein S18 acetylase RimI-like enzyme
MMRCLEPNMALIDSPYTSSPASVAGRVRPLRPLDRAALGRIGEASFSAFGDYESAVYRWLRHPGIRTLVGQREDGQLTGFSMVVIEPDVDGVHPVELLAIAVDPGNRGEGWGHRLLEETIRSLQRLQYRWPMRRVALTVAEGNDAAVKLFRSFEFEAVPAEGADCRYSAGQSALRMTRSLP